MVAEERKEAGIDEAGRGSWAGPVTVAAVILNPKKIPTGLADSKTLSKKRREALFDAITQTSQFCVVHIGTHDIEQLKHPTGHAKRHARGYYRSANPSKSCPD